MSATRDYYEFIQALSHDSTYRGRIWLQRAVKINKTLVYARYTNKRAGDCATFHL